MDRGRLQLTFMLLAGLWSMDVHAETLAESLAVAHKAIAEQDKRAARVALKRAGVGLIKSGDVIPPMQVARYWYLVGMDYHARRRSSRAMDAWRNALIVDPVLQWDVDLVEDKDTRRLFEALRGETGDREEVDARVPEKTGVATAWVDGRRVRHAAEVVAGRHLLQVVCPDEQVYSRWGDLPGDFVWLEMCPDGVDTTVEMTDAVDVEDEMEALVPIFDDDPEEKAPPPPEETEEAPPPPEETEEAPPPPEETEEAPPPPEEVEEAPPPPEETEEAPPPPEGPGLLSRISRKSYVMAGGGVLVVGGVITNFTLVNPIWDHIKEARAHPEDTTEARAQTLTGAFNTSRGLTIALLGSGVAVAGAGYFLLDAPVRPMILPGGAGLTGRW